MNIKIITQDYWWVIQDVCSDIFICLQYTWSFGCEWSQTVDNVELTRSSEPVESFSETADCDTSKQFISWPITFDAYQLFKQKSSSDTILCCWHSKSVSWSFDRFASVADRLSVFSITSTVVDSRESRFGIASFGDTTFNSIRESYKEKSEMFRIVLPVLG